MTPHSDRARREQSGIPGRLCRLCHLWFAVLVTPLTAQEPEPLTLERAIAVGLAQGDQARAAASARDASRWRNRAFYSRRLPQLTLGGVVPAYNRSIIEVLQDDGTTLFLPQNQTNATLTATLSQQLPLTGGELYFSSSLARLSVSGQQSFERYSSTPFEVGIRQSIFRPNTAEWDHREEAVRGDLAERQFLEAREEIALGIAERFFDVYAARVALENATRNAAVNDSLFLLNTGRFEVGRIGENDLLQSELALLRSRTQLENTRLEYDRAAAALRLALNLPLDAPVDVAATGVVPEFEADTARAVAEALKNRASVAEVSLQEVQARRRVSEAKYAQGLGATINASYGYNAVGGGLRSAYSDVLEARQFTLAVEMPLWNWGSRKETIRAAEADQDRTASLSRTTIRQTRQDAHFAALQLSQARRSLVLSAKADTVAIKRFEVAYNRYVIGRISIDNLFIAQNEKDQARTQYVVALRAYWQAHYRLRRLTLFDFATGQVIQ